MRYPRETSPAPPQRAWVVFCGKAELWWLRFLKPGFRHCFVLLRDGSTWLIVDSLAPRLDVATIAVPPDFDLPGWYSRQPDMLLVPAPIRRDHRRPAPWGAFTCVEAVKRLLGIHAVSVLTPSQLFRFLTRM